MGFARGGFTLLISGGCKQINKQLRRRKVREENHRFHTAMHTQRHTHTHTKWRSRGRVHFMAAVLVCLFVSAAKNAFFYNRLFFDPICVCLCVRHVSPNKWTWVNHLFFYVCGLLHTISPNQILWSKFWFENELCDCGGGHAGHYVEAAVKT